MATALSSTDTARPPEVIRLRAAGRSKAGAAALAPADRAAVFDCLVGSEVKVTNADKCELRLNREKNHAGEERKKASTQIAL
jgi:hypothetical protein